jgi:hypothetical protein
MLGVDYVFWFQKKISAAFCVANCFDKKAKTNAARPELTTKTC